MAATESSLSPAVESVVPACMFAPDPGCAEDSPGAELSDAGDNQNGEAEDHLDLTSKVAFRPDSGSERFSVCMNQCKSLFDQCVVLKHSYQV